MNLSLFFYEYNAIIVLRWNGYGHFLKRIYLERPPQNVLYINANVLCIRKSIYMPLHDGTVDKCAGTPRHKLATASLVRDATITVGGEETLHRYLFATASASHSLVHSKHAGTSTRPADLHKLYLGSFLWRQ